MKHLGYWLYLLIRGQALFQITGSFLEVKKNRLILRSASSCSWSQNFQTKHPPWLSHIYLRISISSNPLPATCSWSLPAPFASKCSCPPTPNNSLEPVSLTVEEEEEPNVTFQKTQQYYKCLMPSLAPRPFYQGHFHDFFLLWWLFMRGLIFDIDALRTPWLLYYDYFQSNTALMEKRYSSLTPCVSEQMFQWFLSPPPLPPPLFQNVRVEENFH